MQQEATKAKLSPLPEMMAHLPSVSIRLNRCHAE